MQKVMCLFFLTGIHNERCYEMSMWSSSVQVYFLFWRNGGRSIGFFENNMSKRMR